MRVAALFALFLVVAGGCGGGSSEPASGAPPSLPSSNVAPAISGSPVVTVIAGEFYEFSPTASDADGDALTFSIGNRPAWATFDSATGTLAGTPATTDVGTTTDVTISVSDGTDSAALAAFDLEVTERPAGSALVSWTAPTTNADGTGLNDLAGFTIYYGTSPGSLVETATVNDVMATSASIGDLVPGTWYFAVTAFDTSGNESVQSAEVSKVIP